ncbi:unnamed protein product [Linum tenue]|uniref:DUF4283 domain-containing protein n=1 Tax=Linum tenue TaxID=586396 RepID=A0AAV0IFW2_9ROSI|nr:unnamed protein product [Linum tenue]
MFTAAEKIRWRREWRSALVVKGLGRRVHFLPLSRRLNYLWARNGEIQITDIKNGCFLVRFKNKLDYELASSGGPWLLGDTYLTVHRWFKGFNPWTTVIKSTIVWVQLPELPVEFVNREAVMRIAARIGKPIRVDRATEMGARAQFARVCVEIDLTRPLLSQYRIEGIKYLIQYEGLENICGECGTYGQPTESCDCRQESPVIVEEEVEMVPETQQIPDPTNGRIFGEWMTVKRKERRPNQRGTNPGKQKTHYSNNPFDVLHVKEPEVPEHMHDGNQKEDGDGMNVEKETTMKEGGAERKSNKNKQKDTYKMGKDGKDKVGEEARKLNKEQNKEVQRDGSSKKAAGSKDAVGDRQKEGLREDGPVQSTKVTSGANIKGPGAGKPVEKRVEQTMQGKKGAGNLSPSGHK